PRRDPLSRGGSRAESLAPRTGDEARPLRSRRDDLPQPFAWIVERCLAKDPNDRYASTKDLARDFADLRDRLSDLSRISTNGMVPAVRRSRGVMWASAVIAAGALLVGGYVVGKQFAAGGPPPPYWNLTFLRAISTGAIFPPGGNTVYYSAALGAEPSRVFVTRLDGTASEPLKLDPAQLLSVSRKGELAVLLTQGRNPGNSVGTLA